MSNVDGTQHPHAVTAAIVGACEAVRGNKQAARGASDTAVQQQANDQHALASAAEIDVNKFVTRVIGPAVFLQVLSGSSELH